MCCEKNVSHATILSFDFSKENIMIQQYLSHLDSKLTNKSSCDYHYYVHSGHPTT